tara:strand:+ start:841 stop:1194 length:354 start_codon:yes stop_codon:yes gene_type:complete
MLPGVEISNIIEMVLNTDRSEEINRVLTDANIQEATFIKNLLWVAADPDYQEGQDEKLDGIIAENPLDNRFLQGIMTAIVMVLAAERPFYVNNPNHLILAKLYEAANALMLEQSTGL